MNKCAHNDMPIIHTQMERQEPGAQSHMAQSHLDVCALPTHILTEKTANLGTHVSRQLCTHTTARHMSVYAPVGASSSGSKFRSPRLAFKMCCSPCRFLLLQSDSLFQSSKAILCLRSIRGGTLPLLLHFMSCWLSPSTPPLLQAAFPDELTANWL